MVDQAIEKFIDQVTLSSSGQLLKGLELSLLEATGSDLHLKTLTVQYEVWVQGPSE